MAKINTHLNINPALVGSPTHIGEGEARVELVTTQEMVADERGLVHGGFTFGLADYAAMVAVNDPLVVLGAAEVMFKAPCAVGETMIAEAQVVDTKGKKRQVEVSVRTDKEIFTGRFTCFVLPQHVLDT